jgi:hypothetical protein
MVRGIIYYGIGGIFDKISKTNYYVRAMYFNLCDFVKSTAFWAMTMGLELISVETELFSLVDIFVRAEQLL